MRSRYGVQLNTGNRGMNSPAFRVARCGLHLLTCLKRCDGLHTPSRFGDEIVKLTGLIAFQNLSSKFNSALDLPAQGFCRLPESADRNDEK